MNNADKEVNGEIDAGKSLLGTSVIGSVVEVKKLKN
jgi:hypothetical protein